MKQIIKILLFSFFALTINAQNISIKQIRKAPDSLMIILSDGSDGNHFSYAYITDHAGDVDSVYVRDDSLCYLTYSGLEYCDTLIASGGLDTIYHTADSICYVKAGATYCFQQDTSLWEVDANGIHAKSYKHIGIGEDASSSAVLTVQGRADWNDGGNSVYIGDQVGKNDDLTTNYNVGIGTSSLKYNVDGFNNVAIGSNSLFSNSSGYGNMALGRSSLFYNTTGYYNTGIGFYALLSNNTGQYNIGIGYNPLKFNETGSLNVAIGKYSMRDGTNVFGNVAIGFQTGYNIKGNYNICIGYNAGFYETGSNRLYIENSTADSTGALIYGKFDSDTLRINGSLQIRDVSTKSDTFLLAIAGHDEVSKRTISSLGISDDQTISTTGASGNISIENGNSITLNVDDADADPTNETETATNIGASGGNVYAQKVGNEFQFKKIYSSNGSIEVYDEADRISLKKQPTVVNTPDDGHTFSLPDVNGHTIAFDGIGDISVTTPSAGSHTIQIAYTGSSGTDDQTLSFSNPNLSIEDGNTVDLSALNTDNQALDIFSISSGPTGGTISISHDNNATTQTIDIEESVEDLIGDNVTGGTDISTSYDDATGKTTITYTGSGGADGNGIFSGSGTLPSDVTISQAGYDLKIDGGTSAGSLQIDGGGSSYTQSNIYMYSNASNRGAGIYLRNNSSGVNWYIGSPYSTTDAFAINRSTGGGISAAADLANNQFYIDNTGVGINTTSPAYGLDVVGTARISSQLTIGSYTMPTSAGSLKQVLKTNGSNAAFWGSLGLQDVTDVSPTTTSDISTGNITIGNSAPYLKLDNTSTSNDVQMQLGSVGDVYFQPTSSTNGYFRTHTSTGTTTSSINMNKGDLDLYSSSGSSLFYVNSTSRAMGLFNSSGDQIFKFDAANQKIYIDGDSGSERDIIRVNSSGKAEWINQSIASCYTTSSQTISSTVYDTLDIETVYIETGDIDVNATTNVITVDSAGYYEITVTGVAHSYTSNENTLYIAVYVDGSTATFEQTTISTINNNNFTISNFLTLSDDADIIIQAKKSSGDDMIISHFTVNLKKL